MLGDNKNCTCFVNICFLFTWKNLTYFDWIPNMSDQWIIVEPPSTTLAQYGRVQIIFAPSLPLARDPELVQLWPPRAWPPTLACLSGLTQSIPGPPVCRLLSSAHTWILFLDAQASLAPTPVDPKLTRLAHLLSLASLLWLISIPRQQLWPFPILNWRLLLIVTIVSTWAV